MSGAEVLVVGDVMTDIIVRPEGPLVRGSDRRAVIRSRPGGSGANQAVWLGAMGARVRFLARVGVGDLPALGAYFAVFGVEAELRGDDALPTGVLVTLLDAEGERSFLTDRGANLALGAEDVPVRSLEGIRMLVLSGYSFFAPGPRAAVMGLIAAARGRGIPVAVDPASVGFLEEVGPEAFRAWTSGADLIFANESEALALTGETDPERQVAALGRDYATVLLKRGVAGAVIGGSAGVRMALPARAVSVVDTTGAGDAFAAAFIAAQLRGSSEEAALQAGIAAGADAVTRLGGQPPLRPR